MVYHVHLISIGKKAETAFNVINSDIKMNKIYLLNNDNEEYMSVENEIRDAFSKFPLDGVVTAKINPFDYDDVFKKVLSLFEFESEYIIVLVILSFNLLELVCCSFNFSFRKLGQSSVFTNILSYK